MTEHRAALVLGASGSVGEALIRALLARGGFTPIVTLSRRTQPHLLALAQSADVELREVLVPHMTPEQVQAATIDCLGDVEGEAMGFSVLGVGAGTAKLTLEQHRAVDVLLNEAFAVGLARSGRVGHLAMMSAVGANVEAASRGSGAPGLARFAHVKGEAEQAVLASGLQVVSIFRPAMIMGSRHTPSWLATVVPWFTAVTPSKFKSITATHIAQAMVACAVAAPAASALYHHAEMMALARRSV